MGFSQKTTRPLRTLVCLKFFQESEQVFLFSFKIHLIIIKDKINSFLFRLKDN